VKLKPDNKFQIPDYRGRTAEYFWNFETIFTQSQRPHVFYLLVYRTAWFVFSTSKCNMTTPNALNFHLQLRWNIKDWLTKTLLWLRKKLQNRILSNYTTFRIFLNFNFFRPPDHHFLVACPVNQQIINMWPNRYNYTYMYMP
jgi:hypothetical protein